MKMITSLLLLIGAAITGLGEEPKIRILSDAPNYMFNEDTFLYEQLGFGSFETLMSFKVYNTMYIGVAVYQENGSGGFDSKIAPYPAYHHPLYKGTETLKESVLRVSNTEFQRVSLQEGYKMDQKFTIVYIFYSQSGATAQFSKKITFTPTPENSGSVYVVPREAVDTLDFSRAPSLGDHYLWWPKIAKAFLVAKDENGSVIYNNTLRVRKNVCVDIPNKYILGDYTGTLTVTLLDDTSAVYQLENGSPVVYPQGTVLLGLTMTGGKPVLSIKGGNSFQEITLLCYSDLGRPPHEETLTLDGAGSIVWTCTISEARFFTLTNNK